jgi:hypothetical protein
MIGPDLNNLTNDCTIVKASGSDPFPSHFNDRDWLAAEYTINGNEIFALIHSEYHGSTHPGWCPAGVFINCRYNTVTFAKSTNGGDSYVTPTSPKHLTATIPYQYDPDAGRFGVFSPSNIIEKDGFYYAMMLISSPYRAQRAGACLMRTKDLGDPTSWRAWDGAGFTVRFVNPFNEPSATPETHTCHPVSADQIGQVNRSLTYNTYLNKYFVIGIDREVDSQSQELIRGFYYSFSDDLIHWSDKQLLLDTGECVPGVTGSFGSYPSVLDPSSTDRNFSTVGRTAYLYWNRPNNSATCTFTNDRDILRAPIEFAP